VNAYDPVATPKAQLHLSAAQISFANDPYQAAAGCDALLILTEWKEFADLDLHRIRGLLKYPIIVDGRNLYEPQQVADAGLVYYSIGRAAGVPPEINSAVAEHSESPIDLGTTALARRRAVTAA
jgi:UDPglucose 6-dehydrogenase